MALRLIELIIPSDSAPDVHRALEKFEAHDCWGEELDARRHRIKILVPADGSEAVLDELEKRFGHLEDFRLILLPVEAALPRLSEKKKDEPEAEERKFGFSRLSREELYSDVEDTANFSSVYVAMVILSAVVAAVGIMRDSVVVVIGAMVIAPLLGPNVGLALGTTLGDLKLVHRSIVAVSVGALLALLVALGLGYFLGVDPQSAEIQSRLVVDLADVALALAAGAAGTLAFTSGLSATLVGVMVAVALLPPLVTAGLLLGAGYWSLAGGAILLFFTNLICINLAGVLTFLVQGIRPLAWWEAGRARRATITAITLWVLLLLILILLIVLGRRN